VFWRWLSEDLIARNVLVRSTVASVCSAVVLLAGRASAQVAPPDLPADLPTFSAQTGIVQITASVTDDRGLGVSDLGPNEFVIRDQSRPQGLTFFQSLGPHPSTPVAADFSADMRSQSEHQRDSGLNMPQTVIIVIKPIS
jgi:hypothetical protein